jgi:hypothetical protein
METDQIVSLYGGSAMGTWRDGTFTGGTEERLWKWVFFSIGGLLGDQGGDAVLPGKLRER